VNDADRPRRDAALDDPVAHFAAAALRASAENAARSADTTFRAVAHPVIVERQTELLSALRRLGAHFEIGAHLGNVYLTIRGDDHTRAAVRRLKGTE